MMIDRIWLVFHLLDEKQYKEKSSIVHTGSDQKCLAKNDKKNLLF